MRSVVVGLVVGVVGGALLAWGSIWTPPQTCGDYSAGTIDCMKAAAPGFAVVGGWLLLGVGLTIALTALVRHHRSHLNAAG